MIPLEELRPWLSSPSEDDALVERLEERAVAFVEEQTGRFFGAAETEHEEVLEGNGTRRLWLNEEPDEVTAVEERQRPGDDWDPIVGGDEDGWEVRGARLLRKGGWLWTDRREYRVKYTFGYVAGEEPGDIRQLVMDLVKLKYDERATSLAVVSEQVGPVRYSRGQFTGDLMSVPWVRETIGNWRRPRVA